MFVGAQSDDLPSPLFKASFDTHGLELVAFVLHCFVIQAQ